MTQADTKVTTIKTESGSYEVVVSATNLKHDLKNKVSNTPLAQENSGETTNLALNLNRVKENYKLTLYINDETATVLNNEPNSNKEYIKTQLEELFKAQEIVIIDYGAEIKRGFLMSMNFDEKSSNDASYYKVETNLIVSEDMEA